MLTIGGLTPFTTIDFPGKLAAVVFCQGCPWRCGYCHNQHLLDAAQPGNMDWPEVVRFLEQRQGLLDAVVFSGGEPTLQPALPRVLAEVQRLGFLTGLHTAGPYPDRLLACLPYLDWVGMDLKAPFDCYDKITGISGSGRLAQSSALLLRKSGLDHQFRTTVDPRLMANNGLQRLQQQVADWGAELVLQQLRQHDSLET